MTTLSRTSVLLTLSLAACADIGDESEFSDEADELTEDVAVPPGGDVTGDGVSTSASALTNATTQIVYVNFGGPVVTSCKDGGGYCNNAATNESSLISSAFKKSSIDFTAYTNTTGRTTVLNNLKTWFAKYNVAFTTSRPASGPYTMLVVSPSTVGTNTALRGKSFVDCNNATKTDIVFVVQIGNSTAAQISKYAAHELGHSFGLLHVVSTSDHMYHDSRGTSWLVSGYHNATNPINGDGTPYRCTSGTLQDEPKMLAANLGLAL